MLLKIYPVVDKSIVVAEFNLKGLKSATGFSQVLANLHAVLCITGVKI